MRRNILICITTTALLSSCAYQGVVVEKRFRPVPFSASLGVDAMYNFRLRDNAGQTNSQMVTPDVFATYRVGDYFNDMQEPPAARGEKELEGFRLPPPELRDVPYEPTRVMQISSPKAAAGKIAAHSPGQPTGDVKILRWQTVRTMPIRSPENLAPRIAVRQPNQPMVEIRTPRQQTVRIKPMQTPKNLVAGAGIYSPGQANGDVKILRWQTVRIVSIQPGKNVSAKIAVPSQRRVKTPVKSALSRNGAGHSAKIVQSKHKKPKTVGGPHHRTIASLN